MTAPNLTKAQAFKRSDTITVDAYKIDLDLTDGSGAPSESVFTSHTTVTFAAKPGSSSFVDLVARRIKSATLNGTSLDTSDYREADGIALTNLGAHNIVEIEAECEYSHTGEGLHRFVDPVDNEVYLYTQFETADAKRVFACFDQPDLKATFTLTVTAPHHWKVVSNSPVLSVTGGSSEDDSTARVHTFETTKKMSTYLVALVAGNYAEWRDEYVDDNGIIPLGLYCRASLSEFMDAERIFTETKQSFGYYHQNFGIPYPFGKYDQLFVPEFNAGAMENVGCVTFLEDYVFRSKVTSYLYERRAETILHEMAHMWFGDLVTMRWWEDLWLNESFATFASVLCQANATEYKNAWTTFANIEKAWAYRQDQLSSTHPVAADIPDLQAVEVNFDGITYAKGASVLKQLVAYVGLEPFLAGMRTYFFDHQFGNAEFDDLLGALERSSGRDLSQWGEQWLRTTGLNTLYPRFELADDGTFTSFTIEQSGAQPGAGELRTHRLAVGIYDDDEGKLVRTARVEIDVTGTSTPVPDLVGIPRGKLILVNDDDLTYCAVRLDDESMDTVISRIGDITDPLPRTLCWSTAWEMTRQAEMKARSFVDLVLNGLRAETQIGVVQRLLVQAQSALSRYADERWASTEGWPSFNDAVLRMARNAAAGSDHQLAFVNALLTAAPAADIVALCLSLYEGAAPESTGLNGLELDTELRWRIVQYLAAAGQIDADGLESPAIDAELDQDGTAAGARHAALARASRPSPASKAATWRALWEDDAIPNITARWIARGVDLPGQEHLLEPFTERYFADAPKVWARRSSEVAQTVVEGLYPRWAVTQQAVDRANQLLLEDHPSALKRMIAEGRDDVIRSLACRALDRS